MILKPSIQNIDLSKCMRCMQQHRPYGAVSLGVRRASTADFAAQMKLALAVLSLVSCLLSRTEAFVVPPSTAGEK